MSEVKSIVQLVVLVESSATCAESVNGVLDEWSVEVVVIIHRDNSPVYVRNCNISERCLKFVKRFMSSPTTWDNTTDVW